MRGFKIGNITVRGDVKQPIDQTVHVDFRLVSAAIVFFAIAAIIVSVLWIWYFSGTPEQTEAIEQSDYFVTRSTKIVHNRSCLYYGKSDGFYTNEPEKYKNCRKCGGAKMKEGQK